jgi:hypothetical protein
VDSKLGEGSTFTCNFRLENADNIFRQCIQSEKKESRLNSNNLLFNWKPSVRSLDVDILRRQSPIKYISNLDKVSIDPEMGVMISKGQGKVVRRMTNCNNVAVDLDFTDNSEILSERPI